MDTSNMADLIRFAAKAVKLTIVSQEAEFPFGLTVQEGNRIRRWNPVENVNDALDLSFALKLPVRISGLENFVSCGNFKEDKGSDVHVAVRRVIVQAAANHYLSQQIQSLH